MSSPLFAGPVGGSRYREAPPGSAVADVVACRWAGSGGWDRTLRLVPDGCADLVWDGSALVLVGASPTAGRFPVAATARNVGLRLRPGAGAAVAGCPASELAGAVPLEDLWGTAATRRLAAALAAAPGAAAQLRTLEEAVARRVADGPGPDPLVAAAVAELAQPGATVEGAGRAVGLSARELRRRCATHVGFGPKGLHRVLRFRAFLRRAPLVAAGARSLAGAAADAGYADQSHLGRECRRLTGSSPAELVGRWAAAAETAGSAV